MKRFEYLAPTSMAEAFAMLQQHPDARPLAGGTDLLVQMREGRRTEKRLMSLRHLAPLHEYTVDPERLKIGGAVRMSRLAADPTIRRLYTALAAGANLVGSAQIRNMASVGGNLCNASPSADTIPPLLILDAQAVVAGSAGERTLPLDGFFTGPGKTLLAPGELLVTIVIPHQPERTGSYYMRHTPRAWMDIAFASVGAAITLNADGAVERARIALGAVAPTPIRASGAERALIGHRLDDALIKKAAGIAAGEARPIDDLRASADYRRHLIDVLTQRVIRQAEQQARNNHDA